MNEKFSEISGRINRPLAEFKLKIDRNFVQVKRKATRKIFINALGIAR